MYGGGGEGRGGEEWAVSHPGNGESRRDLGKNHHHHFKGSLEKKKSRRNLKKDLHLMKILFEISDNIMFK